jgi:hypothetical protein
MYRSSKLREVYLELNALLGDQFTPYEILQLAGLVLRTHRDADKVDRSFLERQFRPGHFTYEVDRAMTDGGWKVVFIENRAGMSLTDERPDNYLEVEAKIRRFVGRLQWPRIGTV